MLFSDEVHQVVLPLSHHMLLFSDEVHQVVLPLSHHMLLFTDEVHQAVLRDLHPAAGNSVGGVCDPDV